MNSEEIVRERYLNAEAQHHEAIYQMGQRAPTQPEYWAIYSASGLGHHPIAVGPTEEAAWTLAAEKVLEQLRKPIGLRIKREMLDDSGRSGAGPVPIEAIEATLDKGEPVIVDEVDGSESVLERGEGGMYKTRPRVRQ
jgi:hypothetical protein